MPAAGRDARVSFDDREIEFPRWMCRITGVVDSVRKPLHRQFLLDFGQSVDVESRMLGRTNRYSSGLCERASHPVDQAKEGR